MAVRSLRPYVNKTLSHFSVRLVDLRHPIGALQKDGVDILTPIIRDLGALAGRPLRLIQIGANDGQAEDPVLRSISEGLVDAVLVEPLPHLCDVLRTRHAGNPRVTVEQCAVAESGGEMPFHHFEDNLGTDLTVYSSLDLGRMEALLKTMNANAAARGSAQKVRLVSETVAVKTIDEIRRGKGWSGLDVLVIDAEGLDGELVMGTLRSGLPVDCLFFEVCNMRPSEFQAVAAALTAGDYQLAQTGLNMLALHRSVEARRARDKVS
jgi:FkbM family methyltransferase